ncbi:MAG TPA: LapA family protein [Gammaproteobacteria bacterium]|nr:LapA family protein [Gammaproteobacteria bacterium]
MNWKLFSILLLVALASIFIVQNAEVVELRFLFWKVVMSRALMFVFIMLTGIAVGWLLHSHMWHKQRRKEQNLPESYD